MLSGVHIAQPDVTLILDLDGVIQHVTLSNEVSNEVGEDWRGRPWTETIADSGGGKVMRMVEDARERGVSAFRQVNQRFPSGLELPMEYTTVRLGGKSGLIAIGRNLKAVAELQSRLVAAQQAMEQDYWKLREVETRYRVLFDASNEAVLLLSADMLRVLEANPAAIRALGFSRGRQILLEMSQEDREPFQAMLHRVRQLGRSPGTLLHLGPNREAWIARATLMASEPGQMFMLQLAPAAGPHLADQRREQMSFDDFIERLPDGVVVIDRNGVIMRANQAFLDLVQVGAEGAVLHERISRWLSRPGADLTALIANLNRHGSVRRFSTGVHSELGADAEVEISAAASADGTSNHIALLIRDVSRKLAPSDSAASLQSVSLQSALAAVIDQTDKNSLRDLVRDTVGLVERHYIAAALDLTEGNRTAASEILGLSRQGFYKKLAQYGMEGHSKTHAEDDNQ